MSQKFAIWVGLGGPGKEQIASTSEAVVGTLPQAELRQDANTQQIFERPRHIFSRAWFELLDGLLQRGEVPRVCAYCHNPFQPSRSDQRHCPGTLCQARNADRRRRQDPWRKEYDKMRKRRKRDAITPEEFDQWKTNNPRPPKRKET